MSLQVVRSIVVCSKIGIIRKYFLEGDMDFRILPRKISFPVLKTARYYVRVSWSPKFWGWTRGRKGTGWLRARIGLDRLNVDLSQSANSQSPATNLNIDLVSSLQVQCCVPRAPRHPVPRFARFSPYLPSPSSSVNTYP